MNSGVIALPLMATDVTGETDPHRPTCRRRPYLAGAENSLLQTLVDAGIAQPPAFNPLVVYGPSGIGKSHLLRGLVHRFPQRVPDRKPWVITGCDFARLYASAIELDALSELRDRWSSAGLVVVDCLEELANRPAAQQELLHVLDGCVERDCQFVAACRMAPDDWSWMVATLRSRLLGGLLIPIALPAAATRAEMLRQLADSRGLTLSDEAIAELASCQDGASSPAMTYPLLSGAIGRIAGAPVELEQPGVRMSRPLPARSRAGQPEQIRRIVKLVARHFDLKQSELLGSSRRKSVVQARGIAIYLVRSQFGISFEQLGRSFGNRDHTTILHAFRKIDGLVRADPLLQQAVDKLKLQVATVGS